MLPPYKAELDRHLASEASDVVISVSGREKDDDRFRRYKRERDEEEALVDRFRDRNDPLQILIVTAKLLTGFDAPVRAGARSGRGRRGRGGGGQAGRHDTSKP